jgi:hypothetical protein
LQVERVALQEQLQAEKTSLDQVRRTYPLNPTHVSPGWYGPCSTTSPVDVVEQGLSNPLTHPIGSFN